MSQKQYTTEQIVRLYGMYQPKFILVDGETRDLHKLPNFCSQGKLFHPSVFGKKPEEKGVDVIELHNCRLILRPVSSLTEQELQELAGVMYDGAARCEIVPLNDGTDRLAIAFEYSMLDVSLCHDWYPLNDMAPLKIAQWFFCKQINFINLPADIAVME